MTARISYNDVISKVNDINEILADHRFVFHMNYGEAYEATCYVGLRRNDPAVEIQSSHMGACDNMLFQGTKTECYAFIRGYINGLTTEHQQEEFINRFFSKGG